MAQSARPLATFPSGERLRSALTARPEPGLAGADLEAAVLLCLLGRELLLVRRAARDGDKWSGQIGLPGGRHEPGETLRETALRETREELGFAPTDHGRVLGALGVVDADHRRPHDTRIAIFVAELEVRPVLRLSDEVAASYWIHIDALPLGHARVGERPEPVPAYLPVIDGSELTVWGITFRILDLLRRIA